MKKLNFDLSDLSMYLTAFGMLIVCVALIWICVDMVAFCLREGLGVIACLIIGSVVTAIGLVLDGIK